MAAPQPRKMTTRARKRKADEGYANPLVAEAGKLVANCGEEGNKGTRISVSAPINLGTGLALKVEDQTAIEHLCKVDPAFIPLVAAHGAPSFTIRTDISVFQALIRAIIYQQLNGKAASTILRRFLAYLGTDLAAYNTGDDVNTDVLKKGTPFPTPDAILSKTVDELKTVGLSGMKASYIHNICQCARAGELDGLEELPDEEVVRRLVRIKGVGVWTVQMLLIFSMGRPNVLPCADLGVRKGFVTYFNLKKLPSPAEMETLAAAWAPYRSYGTWYMWRVAQVAVPTAVASPAKPSAPPQA